MSEDMFFGDQASSRSRLEQLQYMLQRNTGARRVESFFAIYFHRYHVLLWSWREVSRLCELQLHVRATVEEV